MKKSKVKKIIFNFLFTICLIICLYCFLTIIRWEKDNRKSKVMIDTLKEDVDIIESKNFENSIIVNPDSNKNSSYWYYINMNLMNVDLSSLVNDDLVGWIQVPGTNIDYPFVQTNDNEYYLDHSFDKTYNKAGWIFLDYRNNSDFSSQNNIIYGHARIDKTMFGSLKNTLNKSWFNNMDNRIVKISTKYENSLWQIFSIYHIKTDSYYISTHFDDENIFQEYIDTSLNNSIYDFNVNVNTNDILLTLSTCYNDNEKLILQAKLIKKEIKNS